MNGLSEKKRPQLKKPDFWLGIVLMLGGAFCGAFMHDFLPRTVGSLVALVGIWIMLAARRRT